jgi:D-lyxose ketol-isomerase
MVNDDRTDNRFYESIGRFPQVIEDEPPLHLLTMDYAKYWHAVTSATAGVET